MKKNRLVAILITCTLLGAQPAAAAAQATTITPATGLSIPADTAPRALLATYKNKLVKVKVKGSDPAEYDYYYYDKNGNKLKNAWKSIKSGSKTKKYYFGKTGKAYRAATDPLFTHNVVVKKIGSAKYGFDTSGVMLTGVAVTADLDGGKIYYFGKNGKLSESVTKQLQQAAKRGSSSSKLRSLIKKYVGKQKSSYKSSVCSLWKGVQPLRANVLQYARFEIQYYQMPGGKEIVYLVLAPLRLESAFEKNNTLAAKYTGWKTVSGKKYYYKNGKKLTGVQTLSGKTYVFTAKGVLVKNKKVYQAGGGIYKITAAGAATKLTGVKEMAGKRLLSKEVGMSLRKAFAWSAMKFFTVSEPTAKTEAKIAEYYGRFGFRNHRGNCYVQAYTFYWMAKLLGHSVRVVRGYIKTGSGLTPHAWCEITTSGGAIRVYDPNFNSEYSAKLKNKNAGWNFTYGAKKTLAYYDGKRRAK